MKQTYQVKVTLPNGQDRLLKDFALPAEIFQVGDEIKEVCRVGDSNEYKHFFTGLRLKVVKVTRKGVYGDDSKRLLNLRDMLDRVLELTRCGEVVIFKIEAIGNSTTPYRWIRYAT